MKVGFCSDLHLDYNSMHSGKNLLPPLINHLKTLNLDALSD